MHAINENVKFASQALSTLNILIGLAVIGYGLYVVFLPWGGVDEETFLAVGIVITFCGSVLVAISSFGYYAAEHQLTRYGRGWSGRSAIAFYALYLAGLLAAIILAYIYGNQLLSDTNDKITFLKANPGSNPSYSTLEKSMRDRFNTIFFHISTHCNGDFEWIWVYIRDHCPATLSRTSCERCHDYYVTMCGADEATCYGDSTAPEPGNNFACPYNFCRTQTLEFIYDTANANMNYVLYAVGALTAVQLILALLLICHVQTKKMAVTVIDGAEVDDKELVAMIAQQGLVRPQVAEGHSALAGTGVVCEYSSSEQLSAKSDELNYQMYSFSEHVDMDRSSAKHPSAPPGPTAPSAGRASASASAGRASGRGTSPYASVPRREAEDAVIDAYLRTNGESGGPADRALAASKHKPTAYSTYQMNMEIALAESREQEQIEAALSKPASRNSSPRGGGAAALRHPPARHQKQPSTTSDEELARALAESELQI